MASRSTSDSLFPPPSVVGIVPMAGRACRLGPLPVSKELLPLGWRREGGEPRLEVACEPTLAALASAGAKRVVVAIRPDKLDLPAFLGSGERLGLALAYRVLEATASMPESVARCLPFAEGSRVALGFGDVLFAPEDAYSTLLERLGESTAEVVLGLFPTADPSSTEMVELAPDGSLLRLEIRPEKTRLEHCWLLAVWGPAFSAFLCDRVERRPAATERELGLGEIFLAAKEAGLSVVGVVFAQGEYRDLGTPERWREAWARSAG
ncbi:MAG: NTP transferase domain-containing protein [Thermoanaerobaculia bacterium]